MANGKYQEWRTEEGLTKLRGYARDGLVDEQIAHNMGIATSTLYEYKKRFPEIAEALKEGKEVIDRQVENALYKRAIGYDYEETETIVEEGGSQKRKVRRVKKHVPADTTAAIFWLKNRKPEEWRDRHQQEHSGGLDVTHQYKDLPPEELKELAKKYEDILADE